MKVKYVDCECTSFDHVIRFITDEEDVYTEVHLSNYKPWYKRFWIAILYTLGYSQKYGHYECTIIGKDKVKELINFLQESISED